MKHQNQQINIHPMTYLMSRPMTRRRVINAPRFPFYVAPVSRRQTAPQVPVNIAETDEAFVLSLAAPGLQKEYFHLSVDEGVLTVKLELPEAEAELTDTYTRREFGWQNFERRFRLPEQVDDTQITATYADGVLTMTLPKRPEVKNLRSITVQ